MYVVREGQTESKCECVFVRVCTLEHQDDSVVPTVLQSHYGLSKTHKTSGVRSGSVCRKIVMSSETDR